MPKKVLVPSYLIQRELKHPRKWEKIVVGKKHVIGLLSIRDLYEKCVTDARRNPPATPLLDALLDNLDDTLEKRHWCLYEDCYISIKTLLAAHVRNPKD